MDSKLIAAVLFTMVTLASTSCTDSPSTASEYLAQSKTGAGSRNQQADSGSGDEDASAGDGSVDDDADDDDDVKSNDPVKEDPVKEDPKTDDPVKEDPKPDDPEPEDPKPAATTYAEVNTKVFAKYCINCHGNKGNVNLESYAKVKTALAAIKAEAVTTKTMPPQGNAKPTADELKLLGDWIDAGALEK